MENVSRWTVDPGAWLRAETHAALVALVDVVELRDAATAGHSRRVAALARTLAMRLGLPEADVDRIRAAGLVHDLGKLAVDPAILTKSGPLTDEEWVQMRTHPVHGAAVVARFAAIGDGARLVRHHHEAWDGTGYPDRLAGEAIPLGARILAVADTFDTLTWGRVYQPAKTVSAAWVIVEEGAGRQWDHRVVWALLGYLDRGMEPPGR